MPDFNIHLVDYANPAPAITRMHLNQPEKEFIRAGVLNLFQRIATEGKARADARPVRGRRRSSLPPDNPAYNIIVNWVNTPPSSSGDYICYFVRSQSQSIIHRLIRDAVPEAQGLTTEYQSQSISEVYVMAQHDERRQANTEQLVQIVFHEFLHNRLEVPSGIRHRHDVHAEDPHGYGSESSSVLITGVQADDPETVGDDERYQILAHDRHAMILTDSFDIDVVYASLARPVSQHVYLRPTG